MFTPSDYHLSEGGEEGGVIEVYEGDIYTAKALYTFYGLKEVRR